MRRTLGEDDTPCPLRSRLSDKSASAFPLKTYDNEDDTADIDYTMALPDNEPFLSRHTRNKAEPKGLKQPPRRVTNYVPPERHERNEQHIVKKKDRKSVEDAQTTNHVPPVRPERNEQPPAKKNKESAENTKAVAQQAEPERRQKGPQKITNHVPPVRLERQGRHPAKKSKESVADTDTAAPQADPERRQKGLQQQPQRSLIGNGAKGPSRRRISSMLQEIRQVQHYEQISTQYENRARGSVPESGAARTSQGAIRSKRVVLEEKTRNAPIVSIQKPTIEEKTQLKGTLTQPPSTLQQPLAAVGAGGDEDNEIANHQDRWQDTGVPKRRSPFLWAVGFPDGVVKKPAPSIPQVLLPKAIPTHSNNKPGQKSRKRSAENNGDSLASQSSSLSGSLGSLRLKKRLKTSMDSIPSPQSRKMGSDRISLNNGDSRTSQSSSLLGAPGSPRLKKRIKTSMDSLPSPPALTQEGELFPPSESLNTGVISHHSQSNNKKRRLDPVLADDVERCEMYEERWIAAQESSMVQLLNHLLVKYSPSPVGKDRRSLRKDFLVMYSSAPFPLVYNRVHASLLYGSLSITHHLLANSSVARMPRAATSGSAQYCGWGSDIGKREEFLELFMGSYEQSTLITALEVVVGREMFAFVQPGYSEMKILESYIDRYIIKSEDILTTIPDPGQSKKGSKMGGHSSEDEDRGTSAWLLRRSLLRSLMLILLLDKAKSRGALGRQCLFKMGSRHKSSLSVLKSLARLLLLGDISKPLSHLNYTLEVEQSPLSEFDYAIKNLAADLRDGVRLARLVEIHLHSQREPLTTGQNNGEFEDWPLSLHLQHPASSRSQKIHNVSIVLSSLNKAGGNPRHVEAKDIVDGHREKTVGLLWSLLSQWGLELLLDWDVIKSETKRLRNQPCLGKPGEKIPEMKDDMGSGRRDHVELLQDWASSIAIKYGMFVTNLTTSFADGKIFALIVHEYERYLPTYSKSDKKTLEDRLRGIGCNSYFASLFSPHQLYQRGRMYSRSFVVAALAYLCSRLVQPSIQERAAMTIQRGYRSLVFRAKIHQRVRLLVLAHECADVVNRKNAAVVIQRAYREFLHIRIQKLFAATTKLQTFGRAYIVRRSAQQFRDAVVMVQQRWRAIRETRYLKRISVAKQAIVGIQAVVRGILIRQDYLKLKQGVCLCETRWRAISLGRQAQAAYQCYRAAALIIQRAFRRYRDSRDERKILHHALQSATRIQALARGHLVRRQYSERTSDIVAIQQWYRRVRDTHKLRAEYIAVRQAALFIQKWRTGIVLARSVRRDYLRLSACVSQIKRRYLKKKRETSAAIVLQRAWRSRARIVGMDRIRKKVILIQSSWRGCVARKESGPRLLMIRRRVKNTVERGVKEEETLGARTKQALGMVKAKATFARGVALLEEKTLLSRECAVIIATDEVAIIAMLAYIETTAALVQKSSAFTARRLVLAVLNILTKIARVPALCTLIAGQQAATGNKDIFAILLRVIDAFKGSSVSSPPYTLLLISMSILVAFAKVGAIRRKLCARKKWVEKLLATLQVSENAGKRRGTVSDPAKSNLLKELIGIFGDGQKV